MPRQRRRRRRPTPGSHPAPTGASTNSAGISPSIVSPWWKPTLGIVFAFSLGLWLGGTASVADFASGVALIVGAIGVAIAAARLLRNRLYENRLRAMCERRDREDRFD